MWSRILNSLRTPALPVFLRLFALFVLPFGLLAAFFLYEQYGRIRQQVQERSLVQMQLVALEIENRIKDSASLDASNELLLSTSVVADFEQLPLPPGVLPVAREWFRETRAPAFLYLYVGQDGRGRLVYVQKRPASWALFVFRSRFLEDHFLTSSSLEPTDALFLFNPDGTPAFSNLIEADFRIPEVWVNSYRESESRFDIVRSIELDGRSYLAMSARLPGLPFRGLLAKPADVAFRSLRRTVVLEGTLLLIVLGVSLLLTRTFARYEVRLVEAREAALEAARARAEFLSTMSHEIRTPLNAVLGTAELLAETDLDTEQRGYVSMFDRAGRLLLTLINDILDFARVEAGKISLSAAEFEPRELLGEVEQLLANYRRDADVELRAVAEGFPGPLVGDARHLRQVIVNLSSNALKFTRAGHVTMKMELLDRPVPPAGDSSVVPEYLQAANGQAVRVRVSVSDTGDGIPKEKQASIFEAFSRVGEDDRVSKGTGLGLAIAVRLVHAMGSAIELESEPGKGSTFSFEIALRLAAVAGSPAEGVSAPGATGPDGAGEGVAEATAKAATTKQQPVAAVRGRVLLAEDNEDNRFLLKAFLAPLSGIELEIAEDGQEALEKAQLAHYDLILMDMSMPRMDGLEATRRLRAWEEQEGRSPVTIIALTAYTMEEEIAKCYAAGCTDYLAKPVQKAVLHERIAGHLAGGD